MQKTSPTVAGKTAQNNEKGLWYGLDCGALRVREIFSGCVAWLNKCGCRWEHGLLLMR